MSGTAAGERESVWVLGAGLAGCEAAWQLACRGFRVRLMEMKPRRYSPAHTYPGSHKALIDAAKVEIDGNARPQLATHIDNLKDYDVVFVGFPNWWYDMPMPLYTFFDEYDFGGKTVIPFCTHGGSRFSGAIKTIRELEPEATVLDGYAIARDRVPKSKDGVLKWLERIGMKK